MQSSFVILTLGHCYQTLWEISSSKNMAETSPSWAQSERLVHMKMTRKTHRWKVFNDWWSLRLFP